MAIQIYIKWIENNRSFVDKLTSKLFTKCSGFHALFTKCAVNIKMHFHKMHLTDVEIASINQFGHDSLFG